MCQPVAAQFMSNEIIALFELEQTESGVAVASEKHYRLVPPEELSLEELQKYQKRSF